jgi:hypothetical protein
MEKLLQGIKNFKCWKKKTKYCGFNKVESLYGYGFSSPNGAIVDLLSACFVKGRQINNNHHELA